MLGRLEAAGVVARADPSTDALLGFELVESGTCWRSSPKKFWRIALALRELWSLENVGALVLKSAAPSDKQCLCLDYDVNFTVFSQFAHLFVTRFGERVGRV